MNNNGIFVTTWNPARKPRFNAPRVKVPFPSGLMVFLIPHQANLPVFLPVQTIAFFAPPNTLPKILAPAAPAAAPAAMSVPLGPFDSSLFGLADPGDGGVPPAAAPAAAPAPAAPAVAVPGPKRFAAIPFTLFQKLPKRFGAPVGGVGSVCAACCSKSLLEPSTSPSLS